MDRDLEHRENNVMMFNMIQAWVTGSEQEFRSGGYLIENIKIRCLGHIILHERDSMGKVGVLLAAWGFREKQCAHIDFLEPMVRMNPSLMS